MCLPDSKTVWTVKATDLLGFQKGLKYPSLAELRILFSAQKHSDIWHQKNWDFHIFFQFVVHNVYMKAAYEIATPVMYLRSNQNV